MLHSYSEVTVQDLTLWLANLCTVPPDSTCWEMRSDSEQVLLRALPSRAPLSLHPVALMDYQSQTSQDREEERDPSII